MDTEEQRTLNAEEEKCSFNGCGNEALCQSGNILGGLVCSEHFMITNGTRSEDFTPTPEKHPVVEAEKNRHELWGHNTVEITTFGSKYESYLCSCGIFLDYARFR